MDACISHGDHFITPAFSINYWARKSRRQRRDEDGGGGTRTAAAVLLRLLPTGPQSLLSPDFQPREVSRRRYELAPLIVFGPTKSMTVTPPHSKERQNASRCRRHFEAV